jgi:hypothetical protein
MPPFTIPNQQDLSDIVIFGDEAEFDSVDLDILTAGFLQRGVKSGGVVSPHAPAGMSVDVSSGVGVHDGTEFVINSASSLSIGAADATNMRIDLVVVDIATGNCAIVAGTAAASAKLPALPASRVALGRVYVQPTCSSIVAANLVAAGVGISGIFGPGAAGGQTLIGGTATGEDLTLRSNTSNDGQIILEDDADFHLSLPSSTPRLTVDSGDYYDYDRAGDTHRWLIGSVMQFSISSSIVQVGVDGSAPSLVLAAVDGTNEGGELVLGGAGANPDWTADNHTGTIRMFSGGTVYLNLSTSRLLSLNEIIIDNAGLTTDDLFILGAVSATQPGITFDTGDTLAYERLNDRWIFSTGSTRRLTIRPQGTQETVFSRDGSGADQFLRIEFDDISTEDANIRFFRSTNTTGAVQFLVFRGNNSTATIFGAQKTSGGVLGAWSTGYFRVGTNASPTNTTAGDLTAVRLFLNDDSNFNLQFSGSNPLLTFDSGDFLLFTRSTSSYGFNVGSVQKLGISSTVVLVASSVSLEIDGALDHDGTTVGFYGTTPATKQTVTGAKGGNAALASLLTALATIGLITDGSSA